MAREKTGKPRPPAARGDGAARPATPRPRRKSGRLVDETIRDALERYVTEDERLLQGLPPGVDFTRSDLWRVLRIMGEVIEGFDKLASVGKAVTVFGSARTQPDDPQYANAERLRALLAGARVRGDHRRGPGDHGGGEQGGAARRRTLRRVQHRAALRAGLQPVRGYARQLPL